MSGLRRLAAVPLLALAGISLVAIILFALQGAAESIVEIIAIVVFVGWGAFEIMGEM